MVESKPIYPAIDYEAVFQDRNRPCLFVNQTELNEAKHKAEEYDWARLIYAKIMKQADFWLTKALNIPATGGGFFHDGGSDYLITLHHYELTEAARYLALAFAWTGREEYLARAREILTGYADRYLTYEIEDKSHRKGTEAVAGGRATTQGINEIKWALPLMWAYDIVYNQLSVDERNRVADQIFHPLAQLTLNINEGPHNHQTWYNTTVGTLGVLLKERRYLEHAIDKPDSGFRFQMTHSVRPEGLWYEGSINYHFFALKALYSLAESLYHSGVDLYQVEPYLRMLNFPLEMVTPSLTCTSINDGRQVCFPISTHDTQAFYEVAYRRTGNPHYGIIVSKAPRVLLESLIYGIPEVPGGELPSSTRIWPSSGLAVLRAGEGSGYKQITFDFLPYAGEHGHRAKLGLEIYGLGRILAPDPGSSIYRDPVHIHWYKKTISHNCLLVDGKTQAKTGLEPVLASGGGPALSFIEVAADQLYPGVGLKRLTGVTPHFSFDLYQAQAQDGAIHTYDWVYHNYGRFTTDLPLDEATEPETGDGYQYIKDLKRGSSTDAIRSYWYLPEGLVALTTLPDGTTQMIAGNGMAAEGADLVQIMRTDPNPVPMVIYRRTTPRTVFRTLIQPLRFHEEQWFLEEPEAMLPPDVPGMKFRLGKEKTAYFFAAALGSVVTVETERFSGKGRLLYLEFVKDRAAAIMIDGGGEVHLRDGSMALTNGQCQVRRNEAGDYLLRVTEKSKMNWQRKGVLYREGIRLVPKQDDFDLEPGFDYWIR
jgi:hypothetical protein